MITAIIIVNVVMFLGPILMVIMGDDDAGLTLLMMACASVFVDMVIWAATSS